MIIFLEKKGARETKKNKKRKGKEKKKFYWLFISSQNIEVTVWYKEKLMEIYNVTLRFFAQNSNIIYNEW